MEALHSSKDETRDKIEQSKVSLVVWRYNKIAKRKCSYFFLSLHGTVQVLWRWKQKYCTGQYCMVFRTILQEVTHVTDQLQNSRVTSWSWNGGLYTWIDEKIVKMKITRRSNFRALQKKNLHQSTHVHVPVLWRWCEGPQIGEFSRGPVPCRPAYIRPRIPEYADSPLMPCCPHRCGGWGKGLGMLWRTSCSLEPSCAGPFRVFNQKWSHSLRSGLCGLLFKKNRSWFNVHFRLILHSFSIFHTISRPPLLCFLLLHKELLIFLSGITLSEIQSISAVLMIKKMKSCKPLPLLQLPSQADLIF